MKDVPTIFIRPRLGDQSPARYVVAAWFGLGALCRPGRDGEGDRRGRASGGGERSVLDGWQCVPGRGRRRRAAVAAAGGGEVNRDKPAISEGAPVGPRRALVKPARTCRWPALPALEFGVGRKPKRPDADDQTSCVPLPGISCRARVRWLEGTPEDKGGSGQINHCWQCWDWSRDPAEAAIEVSVGDPRLMRVPSLRRLARRPAPGRDGVLEPLSRCEESECKLRA